MSDRPTEAESFLPLRHPIFLILLALGEGRLHGYALAQRIRAVSGGSVRIASGPMYRHLKRLLDAGIIEESEERPDPEEDDERRRYYALTQLGRQVLDLETERMAAMVETARLLRPSEA
ncbi:MAG TPA: PadR family transcriptional regulator [Longimicrobiales bacterium]|nr:PadR family transcriptional regulator [Longimicrobiales bacterium]